jgi:uncharacterized membrane protein YfcA
LNLRALRTVPRRAWWTLAITALSVVAFALDRHLGAVFLFGVFLYALVTQCVQGNRGLKRDKERSTTNPSTGLSMTGIATDAGGFFYGEETFERHHLD